MWDRRHRQPYPLPPSSCEMSLRDEHVAGWWARGPQTCTAAGWAPFLSYGEARRAGPERGPWAVLSTDRRQGGHRAQRERRKPPSPANMLCNPSLAFPPAGTGGGSLASEQPKQPGPKAFTRCSLSVPLASAAGPRARSAGDNSGLGSLAQESSVAGRRGGREPVLELPRRVLRVQHSRRVCEIFKR